MKMENSENIEENVTRLKTVAKEIKGNGESLDDVRVTEKLFCALTTKFDYVVNSLEESKDRSRISIEELVCLFQDHELQMNRYDEEISSLENMVQWKVFDNRSPSSGIINISGEAPRNMLSPDNIYKPTV